MSRTEWDEVAEDLRPSLTRWVGPLLYSFARLLRAKVTMEVGVGRGFTSYALGRYARDFGARHYAMDSNIEKVRVVNKINEKYGMKVTFVHGDATFSGWTRGLVDLLFVDILGARDDFIEVYKNLISSVRVDGLIIVHDYFCYHSIRDGVDDYFRDLGYELLTIPHDGEPRMPGASGDGPCGLAIIRR